MRRELANDHQPAGECPHEAPRAPKRRQAGDAEAGCVIARPAPSTGGWDLRPWRHCQPTTRLGCRESWKVCDVHSHAWTDDNIRAPARRGDALNVSALEVRNVSKRYGAVRGAGLVQLLGGRGWLTGFLGPKRAPEDERHAGDPRLMTLQQRGHQAEGRPVDARVGDRSATCRRSEACTGGYAGARDEWCSLDGSSRAFSAAAARAGGSMAGSVAAEACGNARAEISCPTGLRSGVSPGGRCGATIRSGRSTKCSPGWTVRNGHSCQAPDQVAGSGAACCSTMQLGIWWRTWCEDRRHRPGVSCCGSPGGHPRRQPGPVPGGHHPGTRRADARYPRHDRGRPRGRACAPAAPARGGSRELLRHADRDVVRLSYEPPTLSELFRAAVIEARSQTDGEVRDDPTDVHADVPA